MPNKAATNAEPFSPEWHQFMQQEMDDLQDRVKVAEELMEKDPQLPFISAITVAGDLRSAERSKKWMDGGMPFNEAQIFVGSYARLQFWVDCLNNGKVSREKFFEELPHLWRGSDPDDANPEFLKLWNKAKTRKGSYIRDGSPLPRGKWITVYRGQDDSGTYGIAWTTDPKIAQKFARGAATRQRDRAGVVFTGKVRRERVLAYLTGRGESEVIVDPAFVIPVK